MVCAGEASSILGRRTTFSVPSVQRFPILEQEDYRVPFSFGELASRMPSDCITASIRTTSCLIRAWALHTRQRKTVYCAPIMESFTYQISPLLIPEPMYPGTGQGTEVLEALQL